MLFTKDIGIDLGTSNTLVYLKGKGIVIREPSVVAVDVSRNKVLSVGLSAKEMIGRTPGSIVAVKPLRYGVISDFRSTEAMLKTLIKKSAGNGLFNSARVLIGVPSGATEVEKREGTLAPAGTVLSLAGGKIEVACGVGSIAILSVLPEGKKRMAAADFINGRKLSVGDLLSAPNA